MLDIEEFSLVCWCGDLPRKWNRRTGRGILYRGKAQIVDSAAPFVTKARIGTTEENILGHSVTYGT